PLPAADRDGEPALRAPERDNPLAFFAVKEAQPENLAAAVARSFLGVRLECAQCHDHPFAKWTQGQFWGLAAFFAGLKVQGNGMFAPLAEDPTRHTLAPATGRKAVPATFLFGPAPNWKAGRGPRDVLAKWLTSADNPAFA